MKSTLLLMLIFVSVSCGKTGSKKSSQEKQSVSSIYSSSQINIKVYYEEGAEPYTDSLPVLDLKLWDLFQINMNALFEGKNTVIKIPKSLDEMTKMPNSQKGTWSMDDVLSLSKVYPLTYEPGITTFQIYFLNGYAQEDTSIMGFHISNTRAIAVFKNVFKYSTAEDVLVPKYLEQTTLIHEMGHALGLVNNGIEMSTAHQDTANGAHCGNPDCVMYHSNEGAANLTKFVTKVQEQKNFIMFDKQCLDDVKNYKSSTSNAP
jgi:predicted Zn-dependent protease